ncbi:hypothetical protein MHU86_16516 [Fragilaria crotonensis]|nr:hypothetical protein MHU86_16516 [Fragilaria crotonensis]
MIPDLTQSSSQLQIKPSIKNAAVCKLKNSGDRLKTSDKASKKLLRKNGSSILEGFAPGKYDVLCNRSRHAFNHVGNRRFRVIVENHAPGFAALRTKAERSLMIQSILGIMPLSKPRRESLLKRTRTEPGMKLVWLNERRKLAMLFVQPSRL